MLFSMGASENGARGDRPRATAVASKMTAPSRRSEELAEVERQLLVTEDGQVTRAMDVMSLVEAEQRLAREAQGSGDSGIRHIAVAEPPPAPIASAPPLSSPVSHVSPVVRSLPPSTLERGRQRRHVATMIVMVFMLVIATFLAVALLRSGLTLSGVVRLVMSHWKH
jgi:hypothetical protein